MVGLVLSTPAPAEMTGTDPQFLPARTFLRRLRELGWVEGRTVIIERRSAEGRRERAPAIMADLVTRGVNVIVVTTDWLVAPAQAATRTIPIVAILNEDPVAAGLVDSLARPGGNLTGATTGIGRDLYDKRFQLLTEMAPRSVRVAFLGRRSAWTVYSSGARASAVAQVFVPAESTEELDAAFAIVLRERADALIVSHGPALLLASARIAAFAAEHRLPTIFPWREAVDAGGLLSYGPEVEEHFRQMAVYADKLLKGARAAELPIEQPTKFTLSINVRTAKHLGLTIPPALLARVDEVID